MFLVTRFCLDLVFVKRTSFWIVHLLVLFMVAILVIRKSIFVYFHVCSLTPGNCIAYLNFHLADFYHNLHQLNTKMSILITE